MFLPLMQARESPGTGLLAPRNNLAGFVVSSNTSGEIWKLQAKASTDHRTVSEYVVCEYFFCVWADSQSGT
jgi:hypothetical protein